MSRTVPRRRTFNAARAACVDAACRVIHAHFVSQLAAATAIGIGEGTFSKLCRGENQASKETAAAMARLFGLASADDTDERAEAALLAVSAAKIRRLKVVGFVAPAGGPLLLAEGAR